MPGNLPWRQWEANVGDGGGNEAVNAALTLLAPCTTPAAVAG